MVLAGWCGGATVTGTVNVGKETHYVISDNGLSVVICAKSESEALTRLELLKQLEANRKAENIDNAVKLVLAAPTLTPEQKTALTIKSADIKQTEVTNVTK